tara:strand:+ start:339 stop:440 length:102 start_codon:yes stop_codon:yes gene_type:complete
MLNREIKFLSRKRKTNEKNTKRKTNEKNTTKKK